MQLVSQRVQLGSTQLAALRELLGSTQLSALRELPQLGPLGELAH